MGCRKSLVVSPIKREKLLKPQKPQIPKRFYVAIVGAMTMIFPQLSAMLSVSATTIGEIGSKGGKSSKPFCAHCAICRT
jgi:hypothetical protein